MAADLHRHRILLIDILRALRSFLGSFLRLGLRKAESGEERAGNRTGKKEER